MYGYIIDVKNFDNGEDRKLLFSRIDEATKNYKWYVEYTDAEEVTLRIANDINEVMDMI